MKFYDFDTSAPDRRGTGSYKWDSDPHADVIPLWVADMDFRTAPPIVEPLGGRATAGRWTATRSSTPPASSPPSRPA